MRRLKKLMVLIFAASVLSGCGEKQDDFTVLTTPYKQILTIGIVENGTEVQYVDPAQFQDFCYAMNNIQTLYKLSEDSIPVSGTELLITTRNKKYSITLDTPNIRIGDVWYVVDEDTKPCTDLMQDIALNRQVKN